MTKLSTLLIASVVAGSMIASSVMAQPAPGKTALTSIKSATQETTPAPVVEKTSEAKPVEHAPKAKKGKKAHKKHKHAKAAAKAPVAPKTEATTEETPASK